jgi:hypothetical protein
LLTQAAVIYVTSGFLTANTWDTQHGGLQWPDGNNHHTSHNLVICLLLDQSARMKQFRELNGRGVLLNPSIWPKGRRSVLMSGCDFLRVAMSHYIHRQALLLICWWVPGIFGSLRDQLTSWFMGEGASAPQSRARGQMKLGALGSLLEG